MILVIDSIFENATLKIDHTEYYEIINLDIICSFNLQQPNLRPQLIYNSDSSITTKNIKYLKYILPLIAIGKIKVPVQVNKIKHIENISLLNNIKSPWIKKLYKFYFFEKKEIVDRALLELSKFILGLDSSNLKEPLEFLIENKIELARGVIVKKYLNNDLEDSDIVINYLSKSNFKSNWLIYRTLLSHSKSGFTRFKILKK